MTSFTQPSRHLVVYIDSATAEVDWRDRPNAEESQSLLDADRDKLLYVTVTHDDREGNSTSRQVLIRLSDDAAQSLAAIVGENRRDYLEAIDKHRHNQIASVIQETFGLSDEDMSRPVNMISAIRGFFYRKKTEEQKFMGSVNAPTHDVKVFLSDDCDQDEIADLVLAAFENNLSDMRDESDTEPDMWPAMYDLANSLKDYVHTRIDGSALSGESVSVEAELLLWAWSHVEWKSIAQAYIEEAWPAIRAKRLEEYRQRKGKLDA